MKINTLIALILFTSIGRLQAQIPYLVKNLNPTVVPSLKYTFNLTDVNGTLYFTNYGGLYKSDGTSSGTVALKTNFTNNVDQKNLTDVNGTLFFCDFNLGGTFGEELWKTDGTVAGTVMVKDINPVLYQSSTPTDLINVNGILFFWADDGINGIELWKSDGTDTGTGMVKDIYQGTVYNIRPSGFTNVNGTLFFGAVTDSAGLELCKSDGTTAGTVMVKDICQGFNPNGLGYGSVPVDFTNVNGTLYFVADDSIHGKELWKSDGTAAGTVLVKDINPMLGPGITGPEYLTNVNGVLFFSGSDNNGNELWKSDGTPGGTIMLKDINPGPGKTFELTDVNGTLFFVANDGNNNYELWKSDGTSNGTVMVKDINQNFANAFAYYTSNYLTESNGLIYFPADDAIHGVELWKSDGTDAGTVMVMDIDPTNSNNGSHPEHLTSVNNNLFFSAFEPNTGVELWALNTTVGMNVNGINKIQSYSYPNPSSGIVSINIPDNILNGGESVMLSLFDMSGRLVKTQTSSCTKLTIDCSNLTKGIYQYTINNDNVFSSGKIVMIN